jgi:hypothetical protein
MCVAQKANAIIRQYELERERKRDQIIAEVALVNGAWNRCGYSPSRDDVVCVQSDPQYKPPSHSVFEVNQRDIMCPSDLERRRNLFGVTRLDEVRCHCCASCLCSTGC